MRVAVFGGAGFLGSHVADTLSQAGCAVTVFDVKPSPYLRPDQQGIVGDILDADQVSGAVKGCDIVYNFAGIADIEEANARPLDDARSPFQAKLHYEVTPFSFKPKIAHKLVGNDYLDLGQGLLTLLDEMYRGHHRYTSDAGVLFADDRRPQ